MHQAMQVLFIKMQDWAKSLADASLSKHGLFL